MDVSLYWCFLLYFGEVGEHCIGEYWWVSVDALDTNTQISKYIRGMWYYIVGVVAAHRADNSSDSTEGSFQASCAFASSVGPSAIIARPDNGHVGFWQW